MLLYFLFCTSEGLSRISRYLELEDLGHTIKADHLHGEWVNLSVFNVILYTKEDFDSVSIPRLGYLSAGMISHSL